MLLRSDYEPIQWLGNWTIGYKYPKYKINSKNRGPQSQPLVISDQNLLLALIDYNGDLLNGRYGEYIVVFNTKEETQLAIDDVISAWIIMNKLTKK